jgi:ferric-dicitrate binding protein FerR (iron transport regulator)
MYIQRRLIHPRLVSLVVLTILTLTIMVGVPAANAQSTVGTITRVQGVANIQRGPASIAVVPNLPVQLHDKVVTQPGASLTIGLVDNSSLQLGSNSAISIDESVLVNGVGAPSKVELLRGSLHTVIAGAMKGGTYEVHTPNAVSKAHGTEWTQTYSEGDTRDGYQDCRQFTDVDVQDGTVNVTNSQTGAGSQDVHAGHRATVGCGVDPVDPPDVDHSVEYIGLGVLGVGGVTLGVLCATETWDWCEGSNENPEHPHHSSHK